MARTYNTKHKRTRSGPVEYEKPTTPTVDQTGFQDLKTRVTNLQIAGLANLQARADQHDTLDENIDIQAPPFRGLSPDLADIAQLHRDNTRRVKEIVERHEADKILAEQHRADNPAPEPEPELEPTPEDPA